MKKIIYYFIHTYQSKDDFKVLGNLLLINLIIKYAEIYALNY